MVSCKRSYLFQAYILVVFLLYMAPSNASEIVEEICSSTRFPSPCQEILESTPGADTADLKGIAKIVLELAHSKASETLDRLGSLIPKSDDPKLKETYKSCSEFYEDAIGDLKEAENDFEQGDYYGMNAQASAAMTEAGDCEDETQDLEVDPSIKKGNQDLDRICGIILAVSNRL